MRAVISRLLLLLSACLALSSFRAEAAALPSAMLPIYSGSSALAALARDNLGNLCIVGSYDSTMTVGTDIMGKLGSGIRDIFVLQYTTEGVELRRGISTSNSATTVTPTAIATDDSGNCYIAGTYESGAVSGLGLPATLGQRDGFVAKWTTSGTFAWSAQIPAGTGGTAVPTDIAVDSTTGTVFVSGDFSTGLAPAGLTPITAVGSRDAMIFGLNATTGAFAWGKTFGGTASGTLANGKRLALDKTAGNIYLALEYSGGGLTTPIRLNLTGGQTIAVVRVSYDGRDATYMQGLVGSTNTMVNVGGLALDNAGILHIGGNFDGGAIVGPGDAAMDPLGTDTGFLVRMTTDGEIRSATPFGGIGASVQVRSVGLDPQGRAFLAGTLGGAGLAVPAAATLTRAGVRDGLAVGFDSSGGIAWARRYGGAGASLIAGGMAVDADGLIYWAGSFSGGALTVPSTYPNVSSGSLVAKDMPTLTLTIASPSNGTVRDGGGDLVCGTSCSASYTAGTAVALTATPATGYVFAGW
ncbi:MAG: hypothetical protein J0H82_00005, partial [Alphaproteobacteria bacterium]|nr:hypothetical protein [Alphaproteobacteria bacterium]